MSESEENFEIKSKEDILGIFLAFKVNKDQANYFRIEKLFKKSLEFNLSKTPRTKVRKSVFEHLKNASHF